LMVLELDQGQLLLFSPR